MIIPAFTIINPHTIIIQHYHERVTRATRCECGAVAVTVATFRILPLKGSDNDGRERNNIGVLLVCADCETKMREDEEIMKHRRTITQPTIFTPLETAFASATPAPPTHRNTKKGSIQTKWLAILDWIEKRSSVTIAEICREFRMNPDSVAVMMGKFRDRGFLTVERCGQYYIYHWSDNYASME